MTSETISAIPQKSPELTTLVSKRINDVKRDTDFLTFLEKLVKHLISGMCGCPMAIFDGFMHVIIASRTKDNEIGLIQFVPIMTIFVYVFAAFEKYFNFR